MKQRVLFLIVFCLIGCGGGAQIPDWFSAGSGHLQDFKMDYLSGKERIAGVHFDKAVSEIKRSGDLDLLAKAYLTKVAVQVAVLEETDGENYIAVREVLSTEENAAFFNFLQGRIAQLNARSLPVQYRGVVGALRSGSTDKVERELQNMNDPLSQLIATGVAVRQNQFSERILKNAVETASKNGWKKALLAYLKQLQIFYETRLEAEKAGKVRQTIQLLQN